ncbi:MAG: MFS transporter [Parvibaculaceae bacterium]
MRPLTFYLGGLVSWFGAIGIQTVLFPFLVTIYLGQGPAELGFAMMALFLPTMLLILLGGATADHIDSRRILILVHVLAGLPAIGLFAAYLTDTLTYPLLIVYALIMGTAGAFIIPARDSLLSYISGSNIQKAVMAATAFQFGAQIVGFGLAAMEPLIGVGVIFLCQAALLWAGAALAVYLPTHKPTGGRAPSIGAIADGLREVRNTPRLFAPTAIVFGVGILFFGTSQVVLPIFVRDIFDGGSPELAYTNIAMMTGIILTATLIGRAGGIVRQGRALIIALFWGAFVMASFSIAPSFPLFVLVAFFWGCGGGVAMTMNRTIIQESAPPTHRARVLAVFQMGVLGGAPIGAFLSGFYIEWFGPHIAVLIPSAGMLVMLMLACAATPIWSIRTLATAAASD